MKAVLESLLLVSETPLKLGTLAGVLGEEEGRVAAAMDQLCQEYRARAGGVQIVEVEGGVQFRTPEGHAEWVRRLFGSKPFRFSRAALETLAIVAYRQPITRAEVEYLRGVDAGGVLRTLLEKQLIRILGKKDVPGKPLIYGTTKQFLRLFGLADLAALPSLKEVADIEPELVAAVEGLPAFTGDKLDEAESEGSDD